MTFKSKKSYEEYLSRVYRDNMLTDEAIRELNYQPRSSIHSAKVEEYAARRIIQNGRAGFYIRINDPIRFNVGYDEWTR